MEKNSIHFIIPYFGKFPNYFQLFLNSCRENQEINWTIITDNHSPYNYPKNVHVIHWSFDQLKNRIQKKFDFKVCLDTPYKLCDFRPAYGYLFSDMIKEYSFWGYCDIDVIYGKISHFINDNMLQNDKIFTLGHMTLIKNTDELNRLFMERVNGTEYYKEVYTSNQSYNFDEDFSKKININDIFRESGFTIWKASKIADIYTKCSGFRRIDGQEIEKRKRNFFVWNNGALYRKYIKNGTVYTDEYMYIHLQKRKMKLDKKCEKSSIYKIIPNSFELLEVPYNSVDKQFYKIVKKRFNLHYFKLRYHNLKIKIVGRLEGINK